VKSLPLTVLKWVVAGVVLYTSMWMFISARRSRLEERATCSPKT
jgi:hypothetical protein